MIDDDTLTENYWKSARETTY